MKKRGILIGLIAVILLLNLAYAQESDKVYVINLNYQKQDNKESLNLISSYITQGYPVNYGEPANGYRLDIISDNKTLNSVKFSVPFGAVSLGGLTNQKAKGSLNNLNFTIYAPYLKDAEIMNVYDKFNNKVLEIPIQQFYSLGESETFEGRFDVVYGYEKGYMFYLNDRNKLYKLESAEALPVSWSGSDVIAKGKVFEDTLILESLALKPIENSIQELSNDKIDLNWISVIIYGATLVVILICLFIYHAVRKGASSNLKLYVIENLKKGYRKEQISKALSKAGYRNKEIEEAFREIK